MPAVEDDDAGALDAVEDDDVGVALVAVEVVPADVLALAPLNGARTLPGMSEQCDTSSPVASETVTCVIDERALSFRDSCSAWLRGGREPYERPPRPLH